jgi:type II secretory pathway pseudopilin PulG
LNKLGVKAFSLVETLVAAAIVGLAVLSVIAVVRKGQDQMAVDKHRRAARAIADTTLEGKRFLPSNYYLIPATIDPDSVTLDGTLKGGRSIVIKPEKHGGIPAKRVTLTIQWLEPGTSESSVELKKLVPYIPDEFRNIAPFASAIAVSSEHEGDANGKHYQCFRSCAVDGIIGLSYIGDWASETSTPWIQLDWPSVHRIKRISLYDRNSLDDFARNATITFSDGSTPISVTIPDRGSQTVNFNPKNVTWVRISLNGSGAGGFQVGLAEVEVYE